MSSSDILTSPSLRLRARGPLACFTRPELKVERVSYPVMTPSAARGLLEAVLWKPAIVWRIESISVLAPIRFTAFRRNEVNSRASTPTRAMILNGGSPPTLYVDEESERAQRNTVALQNVDYLIQARFSLTAKAGPEDNLNKFAEMFCRRVERGQHFHQPYFGCREFIAEICPSGDAPPPISESRDLGVMLWDIKFDSKGNRALWFKAVLDNGILAVPPEPIHSDEVPS